MRGIRLLAAAALLLAATAASAWAGSMLLMGVGGVGTCGSLNFDQTVACNFIAVPLLGM